MCMLCLVQTYATVNTVLKTTKKLAFCKLKSEILNVSVRTTCNQKDKIYELCKET